jgi:hypothetical protein
MAPDFFEFLGKSMRLLERETPQRYRAIRESIGTLRARLTADDATRVVSFDRSGFAALAATSTSDVEARFGRGVVLRLIDGETTLDQAILDDALYVRGSVEAVERFHAAVSLYVEAAVRAPGFVSLLEAYRNERGVPCP